ncbi:sodium/glutamate symporter [Anaerosphaera multitolerans]|uniref:Sodium:glutamate symporter n=1 Tax=Anaerosphaera multitolerans TaxID=2487351 RepID=A0A437S675_9FIRM|nr:sodium/glutamate symporter [Anaerosphaera multitolerans]RVU54520.1 sodium:glutamate symporter [Anaerosphaera multitolerans]
MEFSFDMLATTALGCVIALFGKQLVSRSRVLREWAIPAPVVGGLIVSVILSILKFNGVIAFTWNKDLSSFLMNIFFTCVGFGFSLKTLQHGKKYIIPIFWTITAIVILQGTLGIVLAKAFGIHPLIGVNATTGAHAGGPGTAAAFGAMYEELGAIGATEAGVASATVGLALGSLTGGPAAVWLIRKYKLKSDPKDLELMDTSHEEALLDVPRLFNMVCLILIVGALGIPIQYFLKQIPYIEMPYFIGMLFSGAICRNIIEAVGIKFYEPEINAIESISLDIFLAVTIMTMDLTLIVNMLGPILLMLVLDTIITVGFGMIVAFRAYKKDYAAAVMVAGFIGTSMGSGSNAIANEKSIMDSYGYSHIAWIIFPALSVLAVDIANPLFMSIIVEFL